MLWIPDTELKCGAPSLTWLAVWHSAWLRAFSCLRNASHMAQAAACDVCRRLHACAWRVQGNVWTYNELCEANQVGLRYPESEEDDAFAW